MNGFYIIHKTVFISIILKLITFVTIYHKITAKIYHFLIFTFFLFQESNEKMDIHQKDTNLFTNLKLNAILETFIKLEDLKS